MPRNGSGIYGPPAGTAAVPNTTIESTDYNAVVADMAQALTDSVNVQGTAPFQANQPMGGNKLTGLGAGAANNDSATLGQVQSATAAHASSVAGTADAITTTFSPAFAAYVAKMRFRFTATGANTIANPTVNIDGLGAKTIKKLNGVALAIGDISGSGHVCDCVYNGTDAILLNPTQQPSIPTGGAKGQTLAKASTTNFDTAWAPAREVLAGNRTYYVLPGGNDANTGLVNDNGGAFLTIQRADNVVSGLDLNGFTVTVQVGTGTYTGGVILGPKTGQKVIESYVIQGDVVTPGNVIISPTGADCFFATDGAMATVQGFDMRTTGSGSAVSCRNSGQIKLGPVTFGTIVDSAIFTTGTGSMIRITGNYTINGNSNNHISCNNGSYVLAPNNLTATLVGSRAISPFVISIANALVSIGGITFTGTNTGSRGNYSLGGGGIIGSTTIPGTTGPTVASPGWTF